MPVRKRSVSATAMGKGAIAQPPPLITYSPNDLRDKVRQSLAALSEVDRTAICHRLLAGLTSAGVNIGSSVMVLGIPARRVDEFTPSDMGKMLRYVLINWPKAITDLAGLLTELLATANPEPMSAGERTGRAA